MAVKPKLLGGRYSPRQWKELTDQQLRDELSDLRDEQRAYQAELKKIKKELGSRPSVEDIGYWGSPIDVQEDIDRTKAEIASIKKILEARKEARLRKREAEKPPKAAVFRRRGGEVSRANPRKKNPTMRQIMRDALK